MSNIFFFYNVIKTIYNFFFYFFHKLFYKKKNISSLIFFSPLEQFEVCNNFKIISIKNSYQTDILTVYTYFTQIFINVNSFTENTMIILFYFACFFYFFFNSSYFYPYSWFQLFFEKLFTDIEKFFIKNTGLSNQPLLISFSTLIISLTTFNIIGIIPFGFTATSHIIITFFYSFSVFFGINFIASFRHKINIFDIFLPKGTPIILEPLLVYIEVISYFSRIFSLSIRLFANMMAGHALLNILTSFIFAAIASNSFNFFISFFGIAILFIIIFMELIIAFLQVYVFSTLITLYIIDIHTTNHLFFLYKIYKKLNF